MNQESLKSAVVVVCFLALFILVKRHAKDRRRNWAMFFSGLYVAAMLPLIDDFCIHKGWWTYGSGKDLEHYLPADIYFLWLTLWGVFPILYLRKIGLIVFFILFLWIDLLVLPQMELLDMISLNDNWIYGEVLLITVVFIPAYTWAYIYYFNKWLYLRTAFQIFVTGVLFILLLPLYLYRIDFVNFSPYDWSLSTLLALFFIGIPGLTAAMYLSIYGRGTPFPYDATRNLVRSGPYAYSRNPIQISFTFIFIVLAYHYSSAIFLLGCIVSIAYSLAIALPYEKVDMIEKFGEEYSDYADNTPLWFFKWNSKVLPSAIFQYNPRSKAEVAFARLLGIFKLRRLRILKNIDTRSSRSPQYMICDQEKKHTGFRAMIKTLPHANVLLAYLSWILDLPYLIFCDHSSGED